MRYFLDTNIFLRVLVHEEKKEKDQTACIQLLTKIKKNQVEACTSTLNLAEVAWTLSSFYRFSKAEVIRAVKSIVNLHGLKIVNSFDLFLAISLFEKHSVKFIDALIASQEDLDSRKMTIISFDKDFDKLKILRRKPQEVKSGI